MKHRTAAEWAAILREQEKSGESASAFCNRKGITASSFFSARAAAKQKGGAKKKAHPKGELIKFVADGHQQLNGHIRLEAHGIAAIVSSDNETGLRTALKVLREGHESV